jgi:hypothetical protein
MQRNKPRSDDKQRGSTLMLSVVAIFLLLGMAAISIDFLTLYVARTDAQRAADAAALAGAKVFVSSGCTTAADCTSGTTSTIVKREAEDVGSQNKVFGQYANIADTDITFPASPTNDAHDPMVEVNVHRVMPTLLAAALTRMLGGNANGVTVAAKATAEAFNPTGSSTPFATSCIKPWLMPNCDPDLNHIPGNQNPLCPTTAGYFIKNNQVVYPTYYANDTGGVLGEPWQLHQNSVPSQYADISFTGSSSSGSVYKNEIETCAPEGALACGGTVTVITGNKVGNTNQGTNSLINGPAPGQDTIDTGQPPPFPITAGQNNPIFPPGTVGISLSPSIVTVPVSTGAAVCPGNSCATQQIAGFMQLFIQSVGLGAQDQVNAVILNIAACNVSNSGGSGSGVPPVGSGGTSLIPVRLVRNP